MSGDSSLISTITRFIRFGTKYGEPIWGSEMCAIVTTVEVYPRFRGTIASVNLLDVGILVLLILAAYNGYRRGATLQLAAYAGLILGLLVGALIAPSLAGLAHSSLGQATIALTVLFAAAGLGDALGWFVGLRIW